MAENGIIDRIVHFFVINEGKHLVNDDQPIIKKHTKK